jgi:hypothetical protein
VGPGGFADRSQVVACHGRAQGSDATRITLSRTGPRHFVGWLSDEMTFISALSCFNDRLQFPSNFLVRFRTVVVLSGTITAHRHCR